MTILEFPTSTSVLQAVTHDTPLGPMRLIASPAGLRLCDFVDRKNLDVALGRAGGVFESPGEATEAGTILRAACGELDAYFAGRLRAFSVPFDLPAGGFSRLAWDALRAIPFGETRSYAQQAAAIGQPSAVRTVANANGRNFIAILIPCHRVIGSDGTLTGYGGGLERKRWLLDHERKLARGRGLFDNESDRA